jgi:hypothetical protein
MTTRMTRRTGVLFAMLIVLLASSQALAFSGGPPNGRTNAPGEGNCTACHTGTLNSGDGMLSLAGIDGSYTPGEIYTLELTLEDPVAQRWGFEFTILPFDADDGSDSIGVLASLGVETQISSSSGRDYAKHTSAGTFPGTPDSHTWQVQWTAPDAGTGDVTLYVAGNGANNNNNNQGDRIYATSLDIAEGGPTPVDGQPMVARSLGNYPNPFNPMTTIAFSLDRASGVRLTLYTPDGRRVRTLVDEYRYAGGYEVSWDGTDQSGRSLPSGTYLARLESDHGNATHRLTLVR